MAWWGLFQRTDEQKPWRCTSQSDRRVTVHRNPELCTLFWKQALGRHLNSMGHVNRESHVHMLHGIPRYRRSGQLCPA